MTLMPVSSITCLGSSSSKGGSRWIGHRSAAWMLSGDVSSGSPSTLYT